MAKVFVTSTINLPVESTQTIIDVDDPRVDVPAEEAFSTFSKRQDDERKFRSMNSIMVVEPEYTGQRDIPDEKIQRDHDIVIIKDIKKRRVEKTGIKMFKLNVIFRNGNQKTMILPSYVKLYSSHTGNFIPVEFIRSRNLLMDYQGDYAKVADSVELENFPMTDYYSYKVIYEIDENYINNGHAIPGVCNFYLNGLLCNISFINLQMKDEER